MLPAASGATPLVEAVEPTVSVQHRMACYYEVYTPDLVTKSGVRYGHFGAKEICSSPHYLEVCVRPQELVGGSWVNQAPWSCGPPTSDFAVARNETYRCSDLGTGTYRTRARFTDMGMSPTDVVTYRSSSGSRPCA